MTVKMKYLMFHEINCGGHIFAQLLNVLSLVPILVLSTDGRSSFVVLLHSFQIVPVVASGFYKEGKMRGSIM